MTISRETFPPLDSPGPSPLDSSRPSLLYLDSDYSDNEPVEPREFEYGYRYARQVNAAGKDELIQVPLTRDDVLHPQEGDEYLNSPAHNRFCGYLKDVFDFQLKDDPSALVFYDAGVYWDNPELRHHSPDITVILGADRRDRTNQTTFHVRDEGVRPALLIEITSPSTRSLDLGEKRQQYELASVPLYVVIMTDSRTGTMAVGMTGYRLVDGVYNAMDLDERGWLWLEPVQVFLGIREQQVECYDRDGTRIADYSEITDSYRQAMAAYFEEMTAREEAEHRAETEARARHFAEDRASSAEDRASSAEDRASSAEDRAETEVRARESAEAMIRELQAELQRLKARA